MPSNSRDDQLKELNRFRRPEGPESTFHTLPGPLLPFRARCPHSFLDFRLAGFYVGYLSVKIRNQKWAKCVGKGMWL